jgi:hypothetical protein
MVKSGSRWSSSDAALRSVQVAFDVEMQVIEAVRYAALDNQLSPSDQIRKILGLPVTSKPVRPRLTVTLSDDDYALLAERFGIDVEDKRRIKDALHQELIKFAKKQTPRK